jgi:DNA-binding GntR family transcriptional regulator
MSLKRSSDVVATAAQIPAKTAGKGSDRGVPEVVSALEFDILFGRLKPRERLIEDALMLRFGAKRHVVRRALDELVKLGVVVRAPSRGATVRDFTAQEVEEVYELRELLQGRAVQRMPFPVSRDHIEQLKQIQNQHDVAVEAADLRAVDQVNDEFHRVFFSVCGSKLLCDAISQYMQLTRAMRVYPIADPNALKKLRDQHWAMIRALEAGDRAGLLLLCSQHLQPSKAAYLAVRRSIPDTE